MSYSRVIPRDLFNESKLLKCLGRLVLDIQDGYIPRIQIDRFRDSFDVMQDDSDGSIFISNQCLRFSLCGESLHFVTLCNSREPWPLVLVTDDGDIEVFNNDGEMTLEFFQYIKDAHNDTK